MYKPIFAKIPKRHNVRFFNSNYSKSLITRRYINSDRLNSKNIKNLVFKGGGVRGIAYLGAVRRLVDNGFDISQVTRVAGTSAGSINALALGLGYDIHEMNKILFEKKFKDFLDLSDKASGSDNFLKIMGIIKNKSYKEIFNIEPLRKLIYKHGGRLFIVNAIVTSAILYLNFPKILDVPPEVEGWFWKKEGTTNLNKFHVQEFNAGIHRLVFATLISSLFNIGFPPAYLWMNYQFITMKSVEELLRSFVKLIAPDVEHLIEVLKSESGIYKGECLLKWFEELICNKTGSTNTTFADIQKMKLENGLFKDMYFTAVDIESNTEVCFSHEKTPNMKLADAVRSSMSIPIVFKPYRCWNGEKHGLYVDGGLLNNHPIRQFDEVKYMSGNYPKNLETLGFRVDTAAKIRLFHGIQDTHFKVDSLQSLVFSILKTYFEHQDSQHLRDNEQFRTIYIDDKGIETLGFDLTDAQKKELIESGYQAVDTFIKDFGFFDEMLEQTHRPGL
jgi:NTE family protein